VPLEKVPRQTGAKRPTGGGFRLTGGNQRISALR
jgi:hypothetical protein